MGFRIPGPCFLFRWKRHRRRGLQRSRNSEMVDRLSNLVAIFNRPELDFRKNRADGDDILGDAYEYLMRHFASRRDRGDTRKKQLNR